MSNAEMDCAYPRRRNATGILTAATKRTKRVVMGVLPATSLNSDVPTAKNASPNFRNATIAKNALTDLMRAIAVS